MDEYAESARAISLWLSAFCDKTLSYPSMISNAARKVSLAYADMEERAKAAEARAEKAERERDEKTPKEVLEAIDELVEFARERMSMVDWLYYANVIGAWRGQKEE